MITYISIPILDTTGREAGTLHFNPHGLSTRRVTKMEKTVASIIKHLPGCNIHSNGEGADHRSVAIINQLEQKITGMLDSVCGCQTALDAFREFRPFAVTANGTFWMESVLRAIAAAAKEAEKLAVKEADAAANAVATVRNIRNDLNEIERRGL